MFRRFEWLFVALGALAWFLALTPWGSFADPDAFYHAHAASLILDRGPLHAFPWLDLTALGQHFADLHFLYHLILVPGVAIARVVTDGSPFAELWATQIMAPLLATGTVLALWTVLKRIDPVRAWVWTIFTLLVPAFSMRLLLGKASPIAMGLFIVTVGIFLMLRRGVHHTRLHVTLTMIGFLFALSHGGWIIAWLGAGAMVLGDVLFKKFGEDRSWRDVVREIPWGAGGSLVAGTIAGLFVHPNRTELLQFLWVQIIETAAKTPSSVVQGGEWAPALPSFIVFQLAVPLIACLLGAWGVIISAPSEHHRDRYRRLVVLALPVALTLALTLKSRRFIEYLAPAFVLWVAALWTLVDVGRLKESLRMLFTSWPPMVRRIALPVIMLVLATLIAHQAAIAAIHVRRVGNRSFDLWRGTFAAISARAASGDRVFTSDWDEFPNLFAADDRLRFVSGLDPVYLASADPRLSDDVYRVTRGQADADTTWDVIFNKTGSTYVFITTTRHLQFDAILRSDPRFQELSRTDDTAAYAVLPKEKR